jgi:glucose-1-phosphate adenylyltransferase
MAVDSLVSGGCIISGSTVRRSVLFSQVRVNSFSLVQEAVILPRVTIGRHCRLKKVVIDDGCHIPDGTIVGEDPQADALRFHRTAGGIVLITRDMLENQPQKSTQMMR